MKQFMATLFMGLVLIMVVGAVLIDEAEKGKTAGVKATITK